MCTQKISLFLCISHISFEWNKNKEGASVPRDHVYVYVCILAGNFTAFHAITYAPLITLRTSLSNSTFSNSVSFVF